MTPTEHLPSAISNSHGSDSRIGFAWFARFHVTSEPSEERRIVLNGNYDVIPVIRGSEVPILRQAANRSDCECAPPDVARAERISGVLRHFILAGGFARVLKRQYDLALWRVVSQPDVRFILAGLRRQMAAELPEETVRTVETEIVITGSGSKMPQTG